MSIVNSLPSTIIFTLEKMKNVMNEHILFQIRYIQYTYMSVKFRATDLVTAIIKLDDMSNIIDVQFEIGPIINRSKKGWSIYELLPSINNTLERKIEFVNLVNHHLNYSIFRNHFVKLEAKEITDKFILLSEDDLLDDLDFMHDEITKIRIQMNIMKQEGQTERYNFYDGLINNNIHRMFGFANRDSFDSYIQTIRSITERDQQMIRDQRVQEINDIASCVWDE